MNLGIVTSFLLGGLLLLSVLFFNAQLQSHTQEVTIATITSEQLENITTLLSHDISRIGYQYTNIVMTTLESKKIVFWGDIFDNDELDATKVTWSWGYPSDPVNSTTNPNDYYLTREGPTDKTTAHGILKFPVTYFNIEYLNAMGVPTNNSSTVREIIVEIMVESSEPYYLAGSKADNPQYHRTVFKRSFWPTNLNKNYY